MNSRILSLAVIGACAVGATTATAAPVKLTRAQMDKVVAGVNPHLQTVTVNPGGVSGAGNSCSNGQNCTTLIFKTTGKPN
jgi:hypothetical protein